jgi:uncharacterized protein YjbI with pentapeptide repeats
MHSATPGIGLVRIEPAETEPAGTDLTGTDPTGTDLTGTELAGIELLRTELVGGLGGGAAACAPPQLEQWL